MEPDIRVLFYISKLVPSIIASAGSSIPRLYDYYYLFLTKLLEGFQDSLSKLFLLWNFPLLEFSSHGMNLMCFFLGKGRPINKG